MVAEREEGEVIIHPVILCGGSGSRLWPSSRKAHPKQFAPLIGRESLYQATLRRLSGPDFAAPLVMTGDEFRFTATDQAAEIGLNDARMAIEPAPFDTAPAILAAALLLEDRPEALMLVAPSDHLVSDEAAFLAAVRQGAEAAEKGALVTFGVTPTRPETGFGYLELDDRPEAGPQPVRSFREKPDAAGAVSMLETGRFLWNAGLFLFRVADAIAAFETHAPDLVAPCQAAVSRARCDLSFLRLDPEAWSELRSISFDYAVMERAGTAGDPAVVAVPMAAGWSDLGSWEALWQVEGLDAAGVAAHGAATAIDCRDSYLRSDEEGLQVVGLGLDGIVVVATRDAVLVADKARVQQVRDVVAALRAAGVAQAEQHPRFHRPWGWYESLGQAGAFR